MKKLKDKIMVLIISITLVLLVIVLLKTFVFNQKYSFIGSESNVTVERLYKSKDSEESKFKYHVVVNNRQGVEYDIRVSKSTYKSCSESFKKVCPFKVYLYNNPTDGVKCVLSTETVKKITKWVGVNNYYSYKVNSKILKSIILLFMCEMIVLFFKKNIVLEVE